MSGDLAILQRALGHQFRNHHLLTQSLTHKSRIYEKAVEGVPSADNEQLEFLGDSILGFVVSEALVRRFAAYPEGRLSKLKAHLVSAAHLHQVAQELKLGEYLFLGKGEELSGGREKKALLSDAVEALIAAIYLDSGLDPARRFIEERIVGNMDAPNEGVEAVTDFKSALQEAAQSLKLSPPRYVIVAEEGPEHSKTFTVEVRLGKDLTSQAQGLSKKAAGQTAARQILEQIAALDR
ncbi:MAG: ribonuclease III [Bryobacteraceae bacterium]